MNSQAEFFHNTSAPHIVMSVSRWQMKELGPTWDTHASNSFTWQYGSISVLGRCQVQISAKLHAKSRVAFSQLSSVRPDTPQVNTTEDATPTLSESSPYHHRQCPSTSFDTRGTASVNNPRIHNLLQSHKRAGARTYKYAIPRPDTYIRLYKWSTGKMKFTLHRALKAQKGSWCITLLFL